MKKSFNFTKFLTFLTLIFCSVFCFSNKISTNQTIYSHAATEPAISVSAKEKLNSLNQNLYEFLSDKIQDVANGTTASTSFEIDSSTLTSWGAKTNWTAAELGQQTITTAEVRTLFSAQFSTSDMMYALLHDHPYDLYWFNKTEGMSSMIGTSYTTTYVNITSFTIMFDVSVEYRSNPYNPESPSIDISKTTTPKLALIAAKEIVEDYKALNDYQKLNAYKNKICELVSYNDSAAENESTPYGNPWQLIYVFDNDPSTTVVCEGYAKAFQLLCNLSTFNSSHVKCYTVSGYLGGGHMWNIVTMDDEQNYLVDVTNSDTGTIGQWGNLFLAGSNSGNVASGYNFYVPNLTTFSYNTTTKNLWGTSSESVLNINTRNYEANHPEISVTIASDIVYDNNVISAGLTSTPNVDITFSFVDIAWNNNDYTWTFNWFDDNNNHLGSKLDSAPLNAGYYWIKITATNKTDSSITYVKSHRFEIKPKEISITSIVGINKVYDGTQSIAIQEATLNGVLGTDDVSVNCHLTIAEISGKNVGTYNSVNLSNIKLVGTHKNNYFVSPATNIPSNEISVTPAKPTCSESYTKITESGTKLSDLTITISAVGALDETVEGTYVWTDENGNEIDPSSVEITKDTTYYYIFTPTDSNYESVLVEVKLWKTEKSTLKDFFSKENMPQIIKYSAIALGGIILIAIIVSAKKKSKHKNEY